MNETVPANKRALDEVLNRENALERGMSSVDAGVVGEILDDEYCLTGSSGGRLTEAQAIADLTSRVIRLRRFQSTVTNSWMLCEHACITIGELKVVGHADEQDVGGEYEFTHVWILRDGTWKLRCVHLSRLQRAKQEARHLARHGAPPPEAVEAAVRDVFSAETPRRQRRLVCYALRRFSSLGVSAIARRCGRTPAAVSTAVKQLREETARSPVLNAGMMRVVAILSERSAASHSA
ncbi:MAG: nuclear transport factor 2 family protein [Acidobacteriota bacterium]